MLKKKQRRLPPQKNGFWKGYIRKLFFPEDRSHVMLVFFVVKRRKAQRFSTDSVDLPAPLRELMGGPNLGFHT